MARFLFCPCANLPRSNPRSRVDHRLCGRGMLGMFKRTDVRWCPATRYRALLHATVSNRSSGTLQVRKLWRAVGNLYAPLHFKSLKLHSFRGSPLAPSSKLYRNFKRLLPALVSRAVYSFARRSYPPSARAMSVMIRLSVRCRDCDSALRSATGQARPVTFDALEMPASQRASHGNVVGVSTRSPMQKLAICATASALW